MKKFCDIKWLIFEIGDYKKKYNLSIQKGTLLRQLNSTFIGGRTTDGNSVLMFASKLKIIKINDNNQVLLTERGTSFFKNLKKLNYNLSLNEKYQLAEWYIEGLSENERKLFDLFVKQDSSYTFIEELIPKEFNQLVEELIYLGVLIRREKRLILNILFLWCVSNLRYMISEKQLLSQLEYQRLIGEEAEKKVYEFEKERLNKLGRHSLAERVQLISKEYVNAGFDVVSFNGEYSEPDRFIEVKTFSNDGLFYWSKNEVEVAKLLKEKYWLYIVNFSDGEGEILIIQNPYDRKDDLQFALTPSTYEVRYSNIYLRKYSKECNFISDICYFAV
jgi:Domain of unknown function (DUF3883)